METVDAEVPVLRVADVVVGRIGGLFKVLPVVDRAVVVAVFAVLVAVEVVGRLGAAPANGRLAVPVVPFWGDEVVDDSVTVSNAGVGWSTVGDSGAVTLVSVAGATSVASGTAA